MIAVLNKEGIACMLLRITHPTVALDRYFSLLAPQLIDDLNTPESLSGQAPASRGLARLRILGYSVPSNGESKRGVTW